MQNTKYLIVVAGPTASGKTSLAIELAKYFDAEILSCDSRQFYKEMTIGTAKPDAEELAAAKHHFIDSLSIEQDYNIGDFERDAIVLLDTYFKTKDIAIMVGGSGLYIRAVCEGIDEFPEVPTSFREALTAELEQEGIEKLQAELKQCDPDYYAKADIHNPHRIIRALEVCRSSGQPFSSFLGVKKAARTFKSIKIGLDWNREQLYQRINLRVDLMMQAGLLEEAKQLYPHKELNALRTVGYQEFFEYLDGNCSLEEAVELVKRNSRRYAKRQMTWFRKEKEMIWVEPQLPTEQVVQEIKQLM